MSRLLLCFLVLTLAGCAAGAGSADQPPHSPLVATTTPSPTRHSPLAVSVQPSATLTKEAAFEAAPTATATPFTLETVRGDLANQITRLEDNMPRAASQGYRPPTQAEQDAFGRLAGAVASGAPGSNEADLAAGSGYELITYTDRGDGRRSSYLLRERKPVTRGWGLYAFRVGSDSPLIVEAPHPLADEGTPLIAMRIYRALDARALLIAGAHREAGVDDSADVAHAPVSIFQVVHQLILSSEAVVLQIHGFAAEKHPGYPQVVIGHDQSAHDARIDRLAQALKDEGLRVGVCDGQSWQDLCGETNRQSQAMNEGMFVHIELDESVRKDDRALIAALEDLFIK